MIKGLMAVVEMSKEDISIILPKGIYVACQNSSTNVTLSGPKEQIRHFITELQTKGITIKELNLSNFAPHSIYIQEAANCYLDYLKKLIVDPKSRSAKWRSTSVPFEKLSENWAQYNSAEYHYNNCISPVIFDCIYHQIPENAIVIEIAPHGLLQTILKKELPSTVTNIDVANRKSNDNEHFLLSAIGR